MLRAITIALVVIGFTLPATATVSPPRSGNVSGNAADVSATDNGGTTTGTVQTNPGGSGQPHSNTTTIPTPPACTATGYC